jgi:hypothetical protein
MVDFGIAQDTVTTKERDSGKKKGWKENRQPRFGSRIREPLNQLKQGTSQFARISLL